MNAVLFFFVLPVVAFFLLYGGGIKGFGISWIATCCMRSATASPRAVGGCARAGDALRVPGLNLLIGVFGALVWLIGTALLYILTPLTWLRETLQTSASPVWYDFLLTAAVVARWSTA